MGATTASIFAGFLLYTALLAAALVSSLLLVLRIFETIGNDPLQRSSIITGAAVSGGLYSPRTSTAISAATRFPKCRPCCF